MKTSIRLRGYRWTRRQPSPSV